MCGICGIVGAESREAGEGLVRRMMGAMVHRGPDEEGILIAGPIVAGMRRLSIVDLPGGSQPVWNETGTLAVMFNGEIYNFRDLRAELEKSKHTFRTRSDTEVIVHAYEEWGEGCVERLQGMFAFAVIELPEGRGGRASRIFLARDKLGIKPLYYSVAGGKLIFASEVRALLASGCIPARICAESIPAYMLFGSVCEPLTLIDGVASLPPGHSMTVPADGDMSAIEPAAFWDAGRARKSGEVREPHPRDNGVTPKERVRALLEDAVASHLVADVPVGVFLSSGIDSTAIAALASRSQAGIHTFTVAFPDIEFSEAEKARRTAVRLGTEHSELTLSAAEMVARLDEAVVAFDQPSMDGINTYFVSWAARQAGLKVALSGLGSDELFGGYSSFRETSRVARARMLAGYFPRGVRAFAAGALDRTKAFQGSPDRIRKASAAFVDAESLPDDYFFTRLLFTPNAVAAGTRADEVSWKSEPWWRWLSHAAGESRSMDHFTGISWLELRSYLLNTLLRDTDGMSMRNSLEVRVPFLHAPLVEYILSLSEAEKGGVAHPKALLIAAMGDLLPEEVVHQRKRTFTFPWEQWMRGSLSERVAAGLGDWSPALEAHVGGDFAMGVWRDFLNGRTSWSRPWSLYVLNEWVKRNLHETNTKGIECNKESTKPAAVGMPQC
jgi:asparagine synthase (glutamine-hydrolysing)